jgi:hypothetical protein
MRILFAVIMLSGCATTGGLGEFSTPEYDRKDWRHWVDADKDCQDARQEVLIAESSGPVTYEDERKCRVASGAWKDPYTGTTITEPTLLDVDHVVALRDAHDSGGHAWGAARRQEFANDLEDPRTLRAVARGANRSKGSRGPDQWLPINEAFRCQYIAEFVAIKRRWELNVADDELAVIDYMLHICESGNIPPLPQ